MLCDNSYYMTFMPYTVNFKSLFLFNISDHYYEILVLKCIDGILRVCKAF